MVKFTKISDILAKVNVQFFESSFYTEIQFI